MHSIYVAEASVLPTALWPIPADHECGPRKFEAPEIQVAVCGEGRRWLAIEGRCVEVATSPNMMELYGAGYEIEATRWLGHEGHCVAIQFPPDLIERLSESQTGAFHLASAHALFDARVARLSIELADEYRRGLPNGILFAEGLSMALVGILSHRYRRDSGLPGAARGLTVGQQRIVKEFIETELGSALRVRQLATLVGMSEAHFSRCFRNSFDLTPHRYLLTRRLAAAEVELRGRPDHSLADLALSLGFSSQAHFTESFRRHFGRTPGSLRRGDAL